MNKRWRELVETVYKENVQSVKSVDALYDALAAAIETAVAEERARMVAVTHPRIVLSEEACLALREALENAPPGRMEFLLNPEMEVKRPSEGSIQQAASEAIQLGQDNFYEGAKWIQSQAKVSEPKKLEIIWPSASEMIKAKNSDRENINELHRHGHHDGWYACYDWLREHAKIGVK